MKVTVVLLLAACAAALAGCADSSKMTYLPNGHTGFAINCSGSDASSGWAQCYKQAGDACGVYGYDVISQDDDAGAAAGGSLGGILGANIKNRSMVIQCHR